MARPKQAAPPAPTAPRAPRKVRLWRELTPWLFLAAPLALLITFTYAPVANMVAYSFTDWDGVSPELHYTGADNYVELFTRPELFEVFFVSGYYLAASVVQIVAALYFATILSFNVRFRNFFKGVLFFPYLINGVAIGFVFLYFFQDGGTLDSVLRLFGVESDKAWLGTSTSANVSLAGRLRLALHGPELRTLPRRDPVHPRGAVRGGRARRREPLAAVPAHHRARHPARSSA